MARGSSAITIPLQGGLGNQLFELAAGLALTARHGRQVVFSDHWLRNPSEGETPRGYALAGLLAPHELVHTPAPRVGRATDRLLRQRVIELRADDDALARVRGSTRVVAGYFQRLTYVEEAWSSLRERFASSADPAHRRLVSLEAGSYGAVHYRLGDYVSSTSANTHHGVTSPAYFAELIRDGHARLGITDWQVVSDDTSAAVELLRTSDLPPEVRLTTPPQRGEWDDLAVLASARFCAISNSSFSWWAAYLGAASRPTDVVAPTPWFADSSIAEPLLFSPIWKRHPRRLLADTDR